jgi:redox-sensitive bicupin YhaK (pirin superfamily)
MTAIGFGEHPHRDVEICTYVVDGKLTHKDSMGTEETLERGAIQFMVLKFLKKYLKH